MAPRGYVWGWWWGGRGRGVQATVTYVDSSSTHLSAQGVSGCVKSLSGGLFVSSFPAQSWLIFEEAGPVMN